MRSIAETPSAPKPVTPRARWVAAQRLAAGVTPERAAVQAGIELAQLESLLREEAFHRLRAEELRQLGLPDAEWLKSVRVEVRQAAERALADGRVSTLNWFLRASLDLPALTASGRPARAAAQGEVAARAYDEDDDPPDDAEDDDPDAWLADVPVVEADPSDEALRRSLLGMIEHAGLRAQVAHGPLKSIEQLIVASDPVAYEEWFAKQPKVPFAPMDLPDSIRADIEEVTKHNPPWMRGQYLGYYRPPVPAHLFDLDYANDPEPVIEATVLEPPAPADTIPALRARIARLLDRTAPRLPEELDLAEAVCAIKWPKWPEYRGPIDLGLLRRALLGSSIDGATLNWLGGKEIVRECGAAATG